MSLSLLNAEMFYSSIIYACHQIVQNQEALNAINLFPVPDGDTGNNMAGTAQAIINHAEIRPTLKMTCKSIADASILGARGNSGMIFSQFFNGLLEEKVWPEELNTVKFATLIASAVTSVRASILNPVEGTILTVMDAWAKSLHTYAAKLTDFNELMHTTIQDVKVALHATTMMLDVLKEAHVVDAGAKGFTIFIQGMSSYLANPKILPEQNVMGLKATVHEEFSFDGGVPDMRYCTEAVISGEGIDKQRIAKLVERHGDSVVITANQGLCRVHLHCNEPWHVFRALKNEGAIRYPKVDDMHAQYKMIHQRKSSIALVTDTGADIPQLFADDNHIHFIPVNVHVDNHDFLDKFCIDGHTFYDDLANTINYPTTSFPSLKQIEDKISQLAKHYDDVLILSLSQALSGTHNAICNIAKKYHNIHVINTYQVSGSQGLLLHYAAELISEGLPVSEIKQALKKKIPKTQFFILIKHMDALMRSGRVSKLAGRIAKLAGIKPIITIDNDGKIAKPSRSFSETKGLSKLIGHIKSSADQNDGLQKYCIVHAGVPDKAHEFSKMTHEAFGKEPAFIESVTTAIGLHAGKGSIGLAATFY